MKKKWENSFYTHVTEHYASFETIKKFGHFWKEKMGGEGSVCCSLWQDRLLVINKVLYIYLASSTPELSDWSVCGVSIREVIEHLPQLAILISELFINFAIDRFELSSDYISLKLFWKISYHKDTLLKGVPSRRFSTGLNSYHLKVV